MVIQLKGLLFDTLVMPLIMSVVVLVGIVADTGNLWYGVIFSTATFFITGFAFLLNEAEKKTEKKY